MGRVKWDRVVEVVRNDVLPFFQSQGVKPTLRTIFYALVSRGVIPNTKSAYKTLSRVLVEARKAGIFPWDFIVDKTRVVYRYFRDGAPDEGEIESTRLLCGQKLESLSIQKILSEWFDYLVPGSWSVGRWAEQPAVPEIWIEKEALADTVRSWVYDLEVNVRVNRGYSSWTFIYDNARELGEILKRHERVVVYYLGDLDPSGVDIERFLREALQFFQLPEDRVQLVRLAVTPEQVEEFSLPPRPEDAETLAKIARDPRSKSYSYDYIVELDALIAYVPDRFRELLREAIEKLHDKEIYSEVRSKAERIIEECRKVVEEYKKKALEKILEEVREGVGA